MAKPTVEARSDEPQKEPEAADKRPEEMDESDMEDVQKLLEKQNLVSGAAEEDIGELVEQKSSRFKGLVDAVKARFTTAREKKVEISDLEEKEGKVEEDAKQGKATLMERAKHWIREKYMGGTEKLQKEFDKLDTEVKDKEKSQAALEAGIKGLEDPALVEEMEKGRIQGMVLGVVLRGGKKVLEYKKGKVEKAKDKQAGKREKSEELLKMHKERGARIERGKVAKKEVKVEKGKVAKARAQEKARVSATKGAEKLEAQIPDIQAEIDRINTEIPELEKQKGETLEVKIDQEEEKAKIYTDEYREELREKLPKEDRDLRRIESHISDLKRKQEKLEKWIEDLDKQADKLRAKAKPEEKEAETKAEEVPQIKGNIVISHKEGEDFVLTYTTKEGMKHHLSFENAEDAKAEREKIRKGQKKEAEAERLKPPSKKAVEEAAGEAAKGTTKPSAEAVEAAVAEADKETMGELRTELTEELKTQLMAMGNEELKNTIKDTNDFLAAGFKEMNKDAIPEANNLQMEYGKAEELNDTKRMGEIWKAGRKLSQGALKFMESLMKEREGEAGKVERPSEEAIAEVAGEARETTAPSAEELEAVAAGEEGGEEEKKPKEEDISKQVTIKEKADKKGYIVESNIDGKRSLRGAKSMEEAKAKQKEYLKEKTQQDIDKGIQFVNTMKPNMIRELFLSRGKPKNLNDGLRKIFHIPIGAHLSNEAKIVYRRMFKGIAEEIETAFPKQDKDEEALNILPTRKSIKAIRRVLKRFQAREKYLKTGYKSFEAGTKNPE